MSQLLDLSLLSVMWGQVLSARKVLLRVILPLFLAWALARFGVSLWIGNIPELRPLFAQILYGRAESFPWAAYIAWGALWLVCAPVIAIFLHRALAGNPLFPYKVRTAASYALATALIWIAMVTVLLVVMAPIGFAIPKFPDGRLPWVQLPHHRTGHIFCFWLGLLFAPSLARIALGHSLQLLKDLRLALRHGLALVLVAAGMFVLWQPVHVAGHDALQLFGAAPVMAIYAVFWPVPVLFALWAATAITETE